MIELPTPETDALFYRNGYPVVVDSSRAMQLCEKLEQERDWITEKFKLLEGCFKRAERERDEAREKYSTEATEHMLAINKLAGERDKERKELEEMRAERDTLRLDAQREAEHHDRMVGELEKIYRERDEARKKLANAIEGFVDGGSINENYLMVQIPISPTGFKVGQSVQVILPTKEVAK